MNQINQMHKNKVRARGITMSWECGGKSRQPFLEMWSSISESGQFKGEMWLA